MLPIFWYIVKIYILNFKIKSFKITAIGVQRSMNEMVRRDLKKIQVKDVQNTFYTSVYNMIMKNDESAQKERERNEKN